MKQFLITAAGVFVGLTIFLIGVPFLLITAAAGALAPEPLPAKMVLTLDLRGSLTDQDAGFTSVFRGGSTSVISVMETLRLAEKDNRVRGLLLRLPEGGMAPAAADELRLAIKHFRASGKTVFAHSQGLYPSGAVASTYMLGAATDGFWMQPDSSFQAVGMANTDLFLKRAFDRYGVKANFAKRYEYKNAVNGYLFDDYTPAHRESELGWMGSVYASALNAAAADRRRDPATLRAVFEAGPYLAQDAKAKGLIDKIGQVKETQDALIKVAGTGAKLTDIHDYHGGLKAPDLNGKPTIAFVGAEGAIMTGSSDSASPLSSDTTVRSDSVAKALYDAADDKDVKAIVFRVSSPGGSDTASEQILAAVRAAKAAGKPVVVSMVTYAASGGYWISSAASEIVADPSTLTGSIGVYGGKFAVGEALARFGVDLRGLKVGGDYADAFDPSAEFTPAQKARFEGWMDQIYNGFVGRVAQGRNLPVERVREIAKGRVWTGEQAKSLGLVDHLGGFYEAVDRAKILAKIDGEVKLKRFGGPQSPFEFLGRSLGMTAASVRTLEHRGGPGGPGGKDANGSGYAGAVTQPGCQCAGSGTVLGDVRVGTAAAHSALHAHPANAVLIGDVIDKAGDTRIQQVFVDVEIDRRDRRVCEHHALGLGQHSRATPTVGFMIGLVKQVIKAPAAVIAVVHRPGRRLHQVEEGLGIVVITEPPGVGDLKRTRTIGLIRDLPLLRGQRRLHPHLRPVCLDRGHEQARVRGVAMGDLDLQRLVRAKAGMGEQVASLPLTPFERPGGPCRRGWIGIVGNTGRSEGEGAGLAAAEQFLGDEITVDRHAERLAHTEILERRHGGIERQIGYRKISVGVHISGKISAQPCDSVALDIIVPVQLAAFDPTFGGDGICCRVEVDVIDADIGRVIEAWVFCRVDAIAQFPAFNHIRPVRDIVVIGPAIAVAFDYMARCRQQGLMLGHLKQIRNRVQQTDLQGVGVERFDPNALQRCTALIRRLRALDEIQ